MLLFGSFAVFFGIWLLEPRLRWAAPARRGQEVRRSESSSTPRAASRSAPASPSSVEVIHGLANQVVYLSYLWMLWDSNRQTLGDMVAKSTVIKVPRRLSPTVDTSLSCVGSHDLCAPTIAVTKPGVDRHE